VIDRFALSNPAGGRAAPRLDRPARPRFIGRIADAYVSAQFGENAVLQWTGTGTRRASPGSFSNYGYGRKRPPSCGSRDLPAQRRRPQDRRNASTSRPPLLLRSPARRAPVRRLALWETTVLKASIRSSRKVPQPAEPPVANQYGRGDEVPTCWSGSCTGVPSADHAAGPLAGHLRVREPWRADRYPDRWAHTRGVRTGGALGWRTTQARPRLHRSTGSEPDRGVGLGRSFADMDQPAWRHDAGPPPVAGHPDLTCCARAGVSAFPATRRRRDDPQLFVGVDRHRWGWAWATAAASTSGSAGFTW
jgi:hypothetical protein